MSWDELVRDAVERVALPGEDFTTDQIYAYEDRFRKIYPGNENVRAKVRQCLQHLRDAGRIDFVDNEGTYKRIR